MKVVMFAYGKSKVKTKLCGFSTQTATQIVVSDATTEAVGTTSNQ